MSMVESLESLRLQNTTLLEKLKYNQEKLRTTLQRTCTASIGSYASTGNFDKDTFPKVCSTKLSNSLRTKTNKEIQGQLLDADKQHLARQRLAARSGLNMQESSVLSNGEEAVEHVGNPQHGTAPMGYSVMGRSMTSTPNKETQESIIETPKSILKRRMIIDSHVHVDSKFPHPELVGPTPRRETLNFSYTGVGDASPGKKVEAEDTEALSDLDGSYLEEYVAKQKSTAKKKSPVPRRDTTLNDGVSRNLVLDPGNDRKNAFVVRQLDQRPKSVIYSPGTSESKQLKKTKPKSPKNLTTMGKITSHKQYPLLGYDWIAGLLDNEPGAINQSEEFFEDLKEFRRLNKADCTSKSFLLLPEEKMKAVPPQVQDPMQKPIHGFTVNDRLFTVPMSEDYDPESDKPTTVSPRFVRVSIPRSSLRSPYHIKPHRRRSFDGLDTCSLSQHCVVGWECSKPATIPTASNMDLKQAAAGITAKLSTTASQAESFANQYSHLSKATKSTKELLNTSYALRYELQKMEQNLSSLSGDQTVKHPQLR